MAHTPLQRIFEERVEDLVRAEGQGERARSLLAEVAAGRRSADLIPGRGVLVSGQGSEAHALAYAGVPPSEHELDWLAALLHVARLIDESEPPAHQDDVESIVPALPQARTQTGPADSEAPAPVLVLTAPAECLAELVERNRQACARARIQLELEVEPAVRDVRVPLSPSEFCHAVENLILNAREAQETCGEGGWVRVCARVCEVPLALRVVVEDGGPGLPDDVAAALAANDSEALPGNGLGLAITAGIVLGQQGELTAGSGALGGARLELSLPAVRVAR